MRLIVPLLVLLALASCVTIGDTFSIDPIKTIKIGSTTKTKIANTFGAPYRMGSSSGKLTWTYVHYHYSMFGTPLTKDLIFTFDSNGKVTKYNFNTNDQDEKDVLNR